LDKPVPTPADYAEALSAFVDALGLRRFALLGHSMGALPAAAFCRVTGTERVERLILAAPTSGYASASPELRRLRIEGRLHDMAELGPAGLAEKRAPGLLSAQAPRRAHMLVRAAMKEMRPDGYGRAVEMLGRSDIFAEAKGIQVPTLVLCGSNDATTPPENCRRIAAAIPGARYVEIAGPAHALYIESPGPFDEAVLIFLGIQ
ncbi:MAG: alpha/beta fold hydrolase, partial [Stellaceae bacterium]